MQIIALFGPTGVGKTAVALALARRLRVLGEDPVAVSADALQVYEGMETLTGVANESERAELEHRLLGFVPLQETFSAGEYARLAHAQIDELLGEGRRPILVGGTGLYVRAALGELDFEPAPPEGPSQLWSAEMRRPTLLVGLTMERSALYERIDARVLELVAAGAREEVLRAQAAGASLTLARRSASKSYWRATWRRCSAARATTPGASSPGCARWRACIRSTSPDARQTMWRARSWCRES